MGESMASVKTLPSTNNNLHSQRSLIWAMAISALLHMVAFGMLVGMPNWPSRRASLPAGVITVSMVSVSDLGGPIAAPAAKVAAPAPKPAPKAKAEVSAAPPTPKPLAKPEPKKKPEVSVAVKKTTPAKPVKVKTKVSLKKKTFKPDRARKSAIKNVAKRVDTHRPDTVNSAIANLKAKVARGEGADRKTTSGARTASPGAGADKPGLGGLGGDGGIQAGFMLVYQVNMGQRIQRNWAFSERLAGNAEGLVAEVVVKVARDGRFFDVRFAKRSGNDYLDDSILKAIKKTDRFDPLPGSYRRSTYEAGYRFTSSGIN